MSEVSEVSHNTVVSLFFRHLTAFSEPVSTREFVHEIAPKITPQDMQVVYKYLVIIGDTLMVKDYAALVDWKKRYADHIKANWCALGVQS